MLNRSHTTNVLLKLIASLGLSAAIALIFILPTQATELDPDRHDWAMPQPPATSTNLSGSCPGDVGNPNDLITAINDANSDGAADTITLAAGCVYTLTSVEVANADSYYGPVGLPIIDTPITINGNGATILRDSSGDEFRLFFVDAAGDLTLDSLTLSGGYAEGGRGVTSLDTNGGGGGGGGGAGLGGAIFNRGNITLTQSTLTENTAIGGGVYDWSTTVDSKGGGGGGIAADGDGQTGGGGGGDGGPANNDGDPGAFGGGGGGGGYGCCFGPHGALGGRISPYGRQHGIPREGQYDGVFSHRLR